VQGEQLGLRLMLGRAAVLGRPIGHSRSPALHRAAYAALGLDWTYEAIDCDEGALSTVLAARADWAGFSCTMPLKRRALAVASSASPVASAAHAANTLLPDGAGAWRAENTDVAGILDALAEHRVAATTVTVLGAGGTAQAALVALARLGLTSCRVLVREPTRTRQLTETAASVGVSLETGTLSPNDRGFAADLVISTLPAGAADPLAAANWRPDQALLDVVYAPWPTPLAAAAAERGAQIVPGSALLLHQAARQVELMTGRPAPLAAMRAVLGP
jgi:shikimate dehydrogenase